MAWPVTVPGELLSVALARGYTNRFTALPDAPTRRRQLTDDTGAPQEVPLGCQDSTWVRVMQRQAGAGSYK